MSVGARSGAPRGPKADGGRLKSGVHEQLSLSSKIPHCVAIGRSGFPFGILPAGKTSKTASDTKISLHNCHTQAPLNSLYQRTHD